MFNNYDEVKMQQNFDLIKTEFDNYSSNFDMTLPKVKYKYLHSYRVVSYMNRIAESEGLNEHDMYLAQLIAMYHDIARFEQASKFDTFWDVMSFDHGDRGAEIMLENDWISTFVDNDEDKSIVIKAIKNHNKFEIEEGLTDRELYFAKMIRDADKLDIMKMQYIEPEQERSEIRDDVAESVINHEQYRRNRETIEMNYSTKLCMMLGFIFDFNFIETFRISLDEEIIQTKLDVLKQTGSTEEKVNKIVKTVNDYMESKING